MKNQAYSSFNELSSLPLIGQKKRLNNMVRRLAIGFKETSQFRNEKGQLQYAMNRNSKGILVPVMVTLTYPDNSHWQHKDITKFCEKMTKYAQRNWQLKLRYFWVAETTKNGVIHYHYVTWIPRNKRLPKPSEKQHYKGREYPPLWQYRAKIEGVRKGVYAYLAKYITKGCTIEGLGIQTRIKGKIIKPRLFGYGGFDSKTREFMTYSMIPLYVRKHFYAVKTGDKVQRIKGGWQLKKQNPVSKIWKYFQYGNEHLKTNFQLWSIELNGKKIIGYDYGVYWSTIPELDYSDIWYPF